MLQVEIFSYEGPANNVQKIVKGTVSLSTTGKLIAKPSNRKYNQLFKNLMSQSIAPVTEDGVKSYDPKTDPQGWIENLHLELKSYALMASEAKNI